MSFNITMDFLGLDEVQREIERLATASELKDLNKKIVKKAGKVGLEESEGQIRKKAYSKNPMKSGRRGSRTGQHAADNVPEKGTTQSGNYGEVIGWEKSDTSPFFYMKFHEWGTTMHKPKKFMPSSAGGKAMCSACRNKTLTHCRANKIAVPRKIEPGVIIIPLNL